MSYFSVKTMCGISDLRIWPHFGLILLLLASFFGLLAKADSKASSGGGGIRKFLHISDIHLDINYQENGDESQYCRKVSSYFEKKTNKYHVTVGYNRLKTVLQKN